LISLKRLFLEDISSILYLWWRYPVIVYDSSNDNLRNTKGVKSCFMYNANMTEYSFFHPITVRYGDLDPQGHVNNAGFLTYIEHARVSYIRRLGLWDGKSFLEIGFILARVELDFQAPILMTDEVEVGVRISRLGNKSLDMEYLIREPVTGKIFAAGKSVQVAYDYQSGKTIPLLASWREVIQDFEGDDLDNQ
jgi:acyl-CoA thioester hydrolase